MRVIISLALMCAAALCATAQNATRYVFGNETKATDADIKVEVTDIYTPERGYGYDFTDDKVKDGEPYYFSVDVPDGNYKVTVTLGSRKRPANTTVRAESRRLFVNGLDTRKGEVRDITFNVNKRNTRISDTESVKIKPREKTKLNWDDKLTIEVNGSAPAVQSITIEPANDVPTIFLCGNSTVVDQDEEPWASWGQMITYFLDDGICVANYAESGESANTFIAAGRLKKALSQMKHGDYIFMEFGHNDQKQKGPGKGAYYSFMTSLKTFIDEARERGAYPVLVTPTQRRSFDDNGHITDTHLDYPDAVRFLADKEGVPLIDLHAMTRILYEAMGVDESTHAFVHYPANTFPGQEKELADNTHFNPYGAYQIARCIVEGIKYANMPDLAKHINDNYTMIDITRPDDWREFHWDLSRFNDVRKPDGN